MLRGHPSESVRPISGAAAGVLLGAILVVANGALASVRAPSDPVIITSSSWNITWAPGEPTYAVSTGSFVGGCLTLHGKFAPSSNTSCLLYNAEGYQRGVAILFESVTVNPPFSVAFGPGEVVYACLNCRDIGVNITMPAGSGTYTLNATVLLRT